MPARSRVSCAARRVGWVLRPHAKFWGLAERVLLHAGSALIDSTQPPPAMRHAAMLACMHEGWAADEAAAANLIKSGAVRLEPGGAHRVSTPLVSIVSASTTLALIDAGEAEANARWYGFLGTGGGAQMRFGAFDRAILERLKFREHTLQPGFAALLEAGPVDLLSIARSGLTEGDDLHNRLSSATQVLHAVLASRKIDMPAAHAALVTVLEAPLYFLNLWMPACALMLDAAVGEPDSSLVTRFGANGEQIALQIAGLPERWFAAPATLVRGPYMKGAPENPQFPPVTGDSGIIDAFGPWRSGTPPRAEFAVRVRAVAGGGRCGTRRVNIIRHASGAERRGRPGCRSRCRVGPRTGAFHRHGFCRWPWAARARRVRCARRAFHRCGGRAKARALNI